MKVSLNERCNFALLRWHRELTLRPIMDGGFFVFKNKIGGIEMKRENGLFGEFGGCYVPEDLKKALKELDGKFTSYW